MDEKYSTYRFYLDCLQYRDLVRTLYNVVPVRTLVDGLVLSGVNNCKSHCTVPYTLAVLYEVPTPTALDGTLFYLPVLYCYGSNVIRLPYGSYLM